MGWELGNKKLPSEFQSLFLWKLVLDALNELINEELKQVSILVFMEVGLRLVVKVALVDTNNKFQSLFLWKLVLDFCIKKRDC